MKPETEKKKQKLKDSVYDGDRLVWRGLGTFMDLFFVSMIWFACSLPVVTMGAATAAAYDTVIHCVRRREPGILYRFLSTFKNEFKRATLCTLACGGALAAWALLMLYIPTLGDSALGFVFLINAFILGVAALGVTTWVFPILSRFEMGAGSALGAAMKLVFAHLPATLLMILALALTAAACAIWLFPLIVLPGVLWLVQSIFIEKVFQQFNE